MIEGSTFTRSFLLSSPFIVYQSPITFKVSSLSNYSEYRGFRLSNSTKIISGPAIFHRFSSLKVTVCDEILLLLNSSPERNVRRQAAKLLVDLANSMGKPWNSEDFRTSPLWIKRFFIAFQHRKNHEIHRDWRYLGASP